MSDQHLTELEWRITLEHPASDYRIFRVSRHSAAHPATGEERTFSVIHAPDWVNVIALTRTDGMVLVRQYRHGTRAQTLEIPGGMVEPDEPHGLAARRELREETGYVAERWLELGVVEPNPAIQTNRCYTWLALDVEREGAPMPDAGEVLALEIHPLGAVEELVRAGGITHALVIAAFHHLRLVAGGWRRPDGAAAG